VWSVATTDEFDAWFAGLDETEQVELAAKVKLLEVVGPELGRPHADTLNGSKHPNMKELRANTRQAVLRVAFAFDPNRAAILLCGGNKAGVSKKRFYSAFIRRADKLYKVHLDNLDGRTKTRRK
jgi:hypothetical protein